MAESTRFWFSMWRDGACRAASFDAGSEHGALVENDGHGAMRVVGVTKHGFEETVTMRRAVRGGVRLATSVLVGHRDGGLSWQWKVDRPGLRREETWKIDARGKGTWRQVDVRPGRTTTYHSTGPGRYRGETASPSGDVLWTSDWKSDGRGGMVGSYTDPQGNPAGTVSYPGREQRDNGATLSWTGPVSEGSIESRTDEGSGSSSVHTVVKTEGGVTTWTTDEGEGHSVQTGSGQGRSWITITVPGKAAGDSSWVEMGTDTTPGGTNSDYTVNGISHADGSSSFSRTGTDRVTGDKETTFGGSDAEGNFSYSSSVEHADGSVTVVTRTVDGNGNGTEHVTVVDPQGNTTSDNTFDVTGGTTGSPAGGSGSPGGSSGGSGGPGGGGGEGSEGSGSPGSGSGGSGSGSEGSGSGSGGSGSGDTGSGSDPNSPSEPDSPDSPDTGSGGGGGGGGESGMGSDDGTDDRAPGTPWGKIGHKGGGGGGDDDGFSGIRGGTSGGGGGGDEGGGAERNDQWLRQLTGEIRGAGAGAGGSGGGGGGGDETGWGSGEGFRGVPLVSSSLAPPPPSANESGWGDLNNPRAMTALVAAIANAAAGLAGSGNLSSGLRR